MEKSVANVVHRRVGAGPDYQCVLVAKRFEDGLAAGERFDINGKRPAAVGTYDFAKVIRNGENKIGNRRPQTLNAAFVIGLIKFPEVVELRLAIKIGQNRVEAFQAERFRRQIVAAQLKLKIRRRAGHKREGSEPREGGA